MLAIMILFSVFKKASFKFTVLNKWKGCTEDYPAYNSGQTRLTSQQLCICQHLGWQLPCSSQRSGQSLPSATVLWCCHSAQRVVTMKLSVKCTISWNLHPHQPSPYDQEDQTTEYVLQRCPLHKATSKDMLLVSTPLITKVYSCKQELEKAISPMSWAALTTQNVNAKKKKKNSPPPPTHPTHLKQNH